MRRLAAACWIVAAGGYLILEAVAAAGFKPRYDYAADMISDLGRPTISALAPLMNAGFVLQGTLFFVAAILVSRAEKHGKTTLFVALAATNALGNIVVSTFHSGGSRLHVVGAVLAIVGGNAAILAGFAIVDDATWYRAASRGLATLGLTAFAALAVQTVAGTAIAPNAVLERISVYTITGWQLLSAIQLWRKHAARPSSPRTRRLPEP